MFLVIIIPIYVISINIYGWGIDRVRKSTIDSIESQIEFYLFSLEKDVQRIKTLQFDCVNDLNLIQLAQIPDNMNDYSRSSAILQLYSRLETIKNSSMYINKVNVHIPSLNRTIQSIGSISEIPRERFKFLLKNRLNDEKNILYFENCMILSLVYPSFSDEEGKPPEFIIDVELSKDGLQKSLSHFCEYEDSGILLVTPMESISALNHSDKNTAQQILKDFKSRKISSDNGNYSLESGTKHYLIIVESSSYLDMKIIKYIPESYIFSPIKKYQVWLWSLSLVSVIIIVLFSISIYRLIHKPLIKLVKAFKKLETGNFDVKIQNNKNDEFGYLYRQFNAMSENLNTLIDQVYRQKILTHRAELRHLQSQINPHFLYNSFYLLYNMVISEDYSSLERFTKLLGYYFEYITRNAVDEVPLIKEISYAKAYVEIQNQRFHNRISIEFEELPEECYNIVVPKLIIQPIIENVFEHGLANKASDGIVRILFKRQDDNLDIVVEDNGEELTDLKLSELQESMAAIDDNVETTGILNVHKRIVLKLGEGNGLKIERSELGGMKVTIFIVIKGDNIKSCTDY